MQENRLKKRAGAACTAGRRYCTEVQRRAACPADQSTHRQVTLGTLCCGCAPLATAHAAATGAAVAAAGAAGAACLAMNAANLEERAALSALALDFRRRWKKSSVPSTYAICV